MKRNNQFWWLETVDFKGMRYDEVVGKWISYSLKLQNDNPKGWFPCRSYKAAVRHLRKHNEIPKGTKFRLVSPYNDRYLVKK